MKTKAKSAVSFFRTFCLRLRADFWVSAYLRRCEGEGLVAVLRRRGAAEAGGIYIKHDRLDGAATLYGPAPQASDGDDTGTRRFIRLHKDPSIEATEAETRLRREIQFDTDIWIVEVECRTDGIFLDIVG